MPEYEGFVYLESFFTHADDDGAIVEPERLVPVRGRCGLMVGRGEVVVGHDQNRMRLIRPGRIPRPQVVLSTLSSKAAVGSEM